MTDRVIINDEDLDLSKGSAIAITSQLNDLHELRDRQAARSNQFKAPATANNIRILENAGLVQSTTRIPYRRNDAKIIKNGVEVLSRGYAILDGVDKDFNITIYSALIDLMEALGDQRLSDLDFSLWDHTFDLDTVYNSRTNDDGYIYTVIDYNNDSTYLDNFYNQMLVNRNMPCFYVHTIIEKIFEQAGVTYDGAVFTNQKYLRMLLQLGTEDFNHPDAWSETYKMKAYNTIDQTVVGTDGIVGRFFQFPDDSVSGYDPAGIWSTYQYTKTSVIAKFKLHLDVVINSGSFDTEIRQGPGTVVYTFPTISGTGVYDLESPEQIIGFAANPTVFNPGQTLGSDSMTLKAGSYVEVEYVKTLLFGTDVNVSAIMPDMTQKEFLKAILAHIFVGIPSINPYTNVYTVKQFKEIVQDIPNSVDWSDKLHNEPDSWKLEYRIGSYAKKNHFKYSVDDDVEEGYADGYFSIDDETLPPETTILTLPFAPSDWVPRFQYAKIPMVQKWEDAEYTQIKLKPRIFLLDREAVAAAPILQYKDGVNVPKDLNDNVPYCHFIHPDLTENLGFDDSILADEYTELIDALARVKKLTAEFYLTANDINELDHYKPIYLWQFSSYFYLNKVINYKGEGLTKVELIRLGNGDVCVPTFGDELLVDNTFPDPNIAWGESGEDVSVSFTFGIPGVQKDNPGSWFGDLTQFPYETSPVGAFKTVLTVTGRTQGSCYVRVESTYGTVRTTNGTFTEILEWDGPMALFSIHMDADFDGTITYASCQAQLTCHDNDSDGNWSD